MYAPPVLELSEHVLDLVAITVKRPVEGWRMFPVGSWRNAGGDAALDQCVSEPVRIVSPVSQQYFGPGKRIEHESGSLVVAHLAFAEQQDDGAPFSVAYGMEL